MTEESIELVLHTVNFTSWSALMKLHVLCTLVPYHMQIDM